MRITSAARRAALILTIVGSGVIAVSAGDHASAASDPQPAPPGITITAKVHPMAAFGIRWS